MGEAAWDWIPRDHCTQCLSVVTIVIEAADRGLNKISGTRVSSLLPPLFSPCRFGIKLGVGLVLNWGLFCEVVGLTF